MTESGIGNLDINIAAKNPEYEAFERSYSRLVDGIARSSQNIADEMLYLFSEAERSYLRSTRYGEEEKARKIMDIVMSKVKLEPTFYETFTTMMETKKWVEPYINVLKENYKAAQKKTSTSNSEPTTEKTSCLDPNVPDKYLAIASAPAADVYSSINKSDSDENNSEKDLLENKTNRIKKKFASVVTSIARALKHKDVTTEELLFHLEQLESLKSVNTRSIKVLQFNEEIIAHIRENCRGNVLEFFRVLRNFYSWINFGLIESIIEAFLKDDKNVQELWSEYLVYFKNYCTKRVCDHPLKEIQSSFDKVTFKIDSKWKEIRYDMVKTIEADIKILLELESYTLQLCTVRQGCVELVFELPQHVADVIFPPTKEQLQALQEHNIRYNGMLSAAYSDITDEDLSVPTSSQGTYLPRSKIEKLVKHDSLGMPSFGVPTGAVGLVGAGAAANNNRKGTKEGDVTLTMDHEYTIIYALMKARDEYYYIGMGIGVSNEDLSEIEDKYLPDKKRCLYEMLTRRIRQGGLTHSMLCQSLRGKRVGRDDVAREIEALELA